MFMYIPRKLRKSGSPTENSNLSLVLSKISDSSSLLFNVMCLGALINGGSLIGSTKTGTSKSFFPFMLLAETRIVSSPLKFSFLIKVEKNKLEYIHFKEREDYAKKNA